MVPFRHSKLTELFQSFFTGQGRAAMIVNVNPYDTGYDENLHVMKFAAVAQEVTVPRAVVPPPPIIVPNPVRPALTSPGSDDSRRDSEWEVRAALTREVIEISDDEEEDDEDEEEDVFVEHLLDQIRELRIQVSLKLVLDLSRILRLLMQLVESEMRTSYVEAEVRDDMLKRFEGRMMEMEAAFAKRLADEVRFRPWKLNALTPGQYAGPSQRAQDRYEDRHSQSHPKRRRPLVRRRRRR